MDFLKSAVASAIATGPPFPYSFGDKVDIDESIWTLSNGTKRVCSHLLPDVSLQQPPAYLPMCSSISLANSRTGGRIQV